MRRSLVLGDETAHHPFLQSLPPCAFGRSARDARNAAGNAPPPAPLFERLRKAWQASPITATDMRLFLLAYCACFLAVSAFIW
jgi:hypothetical protein